MDKGKGNLVVEGINNNNIWAMDDQKGAVGDMKKMGGDGDAIIASSRVCKAEAVLRLLPMALSISALVVMLTNSENNDYGAISYNNLGAFRYLVHANGICAGYSLLSAVIEAMPRSSTLSRAWTFFLLDQVFLDLRKALTYMILAAGSVSSEVLYLATKGDMAITWSAACGSFGSFCHKAITSVVLTFIALVCYVALFLISSYKLFRKYNAPLRYPGDTFEIPAFRG